MLPKCIRGASLTELKRKYSGLSLSLGLLCGFPTAEILAVFNFRQLEYNDPEAKMGTRVFSEGKLGTITDIAINNLGHYCSISYDDGSMNHGFINPGTHKLKLFASSPVHSINKPGRYDRNRSVPVHIIGAAQAVEASPSILNRDGQFSGENFCWV